MSGLDRYRESLASALQTHTPAQHLPLNCTDTDILVTCFRRALRRGHVGYVETSALTFLEVSATKFWKQLVVIALKDFGLSDLHLLAKIVSAASSKQWRRNVGGDWHVASFLLEQLVHSPCDRRIAKLRQVSVTQRCAITDTADLRHPPAQFGAVIEQVIAITNRCERRIEHLNVSTISASACDEALKEAGQLCAVSEALIEVCMQARRTTQSTLPVLLPLTLAATRSMGGSQTVIRRGVPETRIIRGLPSYVFDGSTYLGHMALRQLAREDRTVRDLLSCIPSIRQQSTILGDTLFAVEGGICIREISDHFSRELLFATNMSDSEHKQLVDEMRTAMRTAIPKLNDIREKLYASNPG